MFGHGRNKRSEEIYFGYFSLIFWAIFTPFKESTHKINFYRPARGVRVPIFEAMENICFESVVPEIERIRFSHCGDTSQ